MNAQTGREARHSRRHPLRGTPPVFDMLAERVLGRALDMSAGGFKLLLSEPLVDDTLYQVRFELAMTDSARVPIVAGIQVLDQRHDAEGMLCAGARFIHLDGACARQLVQWLRLQEGGSADQPPR
jgi:hypothetical protein